MHKKSYSTLESLLSIPISTNPSFSPDGKKIAYLDNAPGTFQLFIKDIQDEVVHQCTHFPNRLMRCEYSPTRDEVLFGKDEGGDENAQLYLYNVQKDESCRLTNRDDVMYRSWCWSLDGSTIAYTANENDKTNFDVFVRNVESGQAECVMKNKGWVEVLAFSPDMNTLVVRLRESLVTSSLYLIDLQTEVFERITNYGIHTDYHHASWLPDSSGFYYVSNEETSYYHIAFYDVKEGSSERFFVSDSEDVEEIQLSPDSASLAFLSNENGYSRLRVIHTENRETSFEKKGGEDILSTVRWSPCGTKIVCMHETPTEPKSICTLTIATHSLSQVSPKHEPIGVGEFVSPETITFESFDRLEISAFKYSPVHTQDASLPVLILIHGGPEAQYRPNFSPACQYFVQQGWVVVCPNVRGSTGYGKEFVALDDREKRMDSVKDIVWLKKHLETIPEVDPSRVVLMGGSYGGYMVLASLAFFPEHWAAGVDIVGMSNLVTFLERTSSYRRAQREVEYGSLNQDRDLLTTISPIHKVENIQAPLYIVHGANDPRVPLHEAEQVYEKLKACGADVELQVYPDEGHGIAKRENSIDMFTKIQDFLGKRLGG